MLISCICWFWEWEMRTASALTLAAALIMLVSANAGEERLRNSMIASLCLLWISVFIFISHWLLSKTKKLASYWRTATLSACSLACAVALTVWVRGEGDVQRLIEHSSQLSLVSGAVLFSIGIVTCIILFIFPLPTPFPLSGKHKKLGTYTFNLKMSLPPSLSPHEGVRKSNRDYVIPVQVWFPLSQSIERTSFADIFLRKRRATFWTSGDPKYEEEEIEALLERVADNVGFPRFLLKHMLQAETNFVYTDLLQLLQAEAPNQLPLNSNLYPVVICIHGLYSWRQMNSNTIESLVQQGCVVFSMDHSPSAMISRPGHSPSSFFEPFDFYLKKNMTQSEEREFYFRGLEQRVAEVQRLLDFLHGCVDEVDVEAIDSTTSNVPPILPPSLSSELGPKLCQLLSIDLSRLSLLGHSYGGGTTLATASRDHQDRIKSCVLLDAWLWCVPDADIQRGTTKAPMLSLASDLWEWAPYQGHFRWDYINHATSLYIKDSTLQTSTTASDATSYKAHPLTHPLIPIIIRGTNHQTFCDTYLLIQNCVLVGATTRNETNPFITTDIINNLTSKYIFATNGGSTPNRNPNPQARDMPTSLEMNLHLNDKGNEDSHYVMIDKDDKELECLAGVAERVGGDEVMIEMIEEGNKGEIIRNTSDIMEEEGNALVKSLVNVLYPEEADLPNHLRTSFQSYILYEGADRRKKMKSDN